MDEEAECIEDAIERQLGVRIFEVLRDLTAHCAARGHDPMRAARALASGTVLLLVEDGAAGDERAIMQAFSRSRAWADAADATAPTCEA